MKVKKTVTVCYILNNPTVFGIKFRAGAVRAGEGAGAASRYGFGSGSTKMMQL
jgi:hypothetical protein